MMRLGRKRDTDDRQVFLFDDSSRRSPVDLALVEAVVVWGWSSVVRAVQIGKCVCLDSIAYFVSAFAEYMNSYVSGAILMCGAVEGAIVGLNEIRTGQKVAATRTEASREVRQEGIRKAIRTCEQAGKQIRKVTK